MVPKPKDYFKDLPFVTIQLPIYNEMYVVERLIDAVCNIDYPCDKFEIQILDDSTDETLEIVKNKVSEKQSQGFLIYHLQRDNRIGYKAGALGYGLKSAKGEFIAIFDADFLPKPEFLQKTIHYFTSEQIGLVQTRWEHINRNYSLLTQVQSIMLDGHFVIEHTARNWSGRFINFNGTAGIWRKKTIESAGGWHIDTLTEDLDLSYRSQLKNWKFVFLRDVVTPAELPIEMNGFKSQQSRWAKGSIQTAKKLFMSVLKAKLPFYVKIEAALHLLANFAYILILLFSLLMFPAMLFRGSYDIYGSLTLDVIIFILAFLSVCTFYIASQREIFKGNGWFKRIQYIPMLLALGIGICVINTNAIIEAMVGKKTEFTRTPKYNILNNSDSFKGKNILFPKTSLHFLSL